ncbi:MAG TPA: ATP-binding protein [Coleofasciculaceae cyanobacterium]|jgi:PAS domain S-box-containing protein
MSKISNKIGLYLKATHSQWFNYITAALSVGLALLLTQWLRTLIAPTISPLFFAAVMFSAWYGGLGSGLFATLLSVLASDFFLIPPLYALGQANGADLLQLFVFSLVALLISSLNASLRAAKKRAEISLAKLQASEEQYRRLIDTANEGIWLLDAQIRTEYVNEQLAKMLGYSVGEMLDRSLFYFVDREFRVEAEQSIERRKQGIIEQFDFCYRRKDGSQLWAIVSTQPRFNRQGKFVGILAMLTDITDRKQIEHEREQLLEREQSARQLAEAANSIKDDFLAVVSHDLRSPLNAIIGWSKLLRDGRLDAEKTEKALEIIERNAREQERLIEDLLDISRIVRGQIRLDLKALNLIPVIEAAIDTVLPTANAKQIQLESKLASNIGLIKGDRDRLRQVLWNLLTNAVKFTPAKGKVTVTLDAIATQAKIQVSDTGIGICPNFLPYVFERYRQQNDKTFKVRGGLGLGLAITHNLVELHGGKIFVDSLGEGKGATFTILLPIVCSKSEIINSQTNQLTIEHRCFLSRF